jgi:mRNA (guanine-N7-)-methyltransferase
MATSSSIPYNPTKRVTKPDSVLVPLTPTEIERYKNFRGEGAARLTTKRKRAASEEPDPADSRPSKRHSTDVGVVVEHCTVLCILFISILTLFADNSRPDVGVVQRLESPIIGLKNFNNWVKSVLITRFGHPALAKSPITGPTGSRMRIARGKVLDLGCGKGGDMTKWSKANIKELIGVGQSGFSNQLIHFLDLSFLDIASVSIEQARKRHNGPRGPQFDATFAALDCYTQSISKAFSPATLSQLFDVVSMQFCMHYAFETVQKARCMLDNVSRYLRPGGVFIGTIPNADLLM